MYDAADFEAAAAHRDRAGDVDYTAVVYRLRHDTQFRLEMAAAAQLGLGHSAFLALPEPDRIKAIGWNLYEGQKCSGCGTHPDDWPVARELDDPFEVEFTRCYACQLLENEWGELQQQASGPGAERALRGIKPRLKPNDDLARWLGADLLKELDGG